MTKSQLKSKQDEFWETSPAYEGRKEIWDALKAACETDDVALAQAIIDGANITLPTGRALLTLKFQKISHNLYLLSATSLFHSQNSVAETTLVATF